MIDFSKEEEAYWQDRFGEHVRVEIDPSIPVVNYGLRRGDMEKWCDRPPVYAATDFTRDYVAEDIASLDEKMEIIRKNARAMIRDQRARFVNQNFVPGMLCPVIGSEITLANLHVDHCPISFEQLLANFIKGSGYTIDQIIEKYHWKETPCGATHYTRPRLLLKWTAYHEKHATLRLTTAEGNLCRPRS